MKLTSIILVAISLSMDAFAISICKGLSMKENNYKKAFVIALYFGLFQALMPIIGYLFGFSVNSILNKINSFLAFIILVSIGISMLVDSNEKSELDDSVNFKTMIVLAVVTSIDALAIGVTFAFLNVNIIVSSILIGIITFVITILGVLIGNKVGSKYASRAQLLGGLILILTGIKILLNYLTGR